MSSHSHPYRGSAPEMATHTPDWPRYSHLQGPSSDPDALAELCALSSRHGENGVWNNVLFAVGNNHRGTYYPIAVLVVPVPARIAMTAKHRMARVCALSILGDLSRFYADDDFGPVDFGDGPVPVATALRDQFSKIRGDVLSICDNAAEADEVVCAAREFIDDLDERENEDPLR